MSVPLSLPGPRVGPEIPPGLWNTIFGALPGVEPVTGPTPLPAVAILGAVLAGAIVIQGYRWVSGPSPDGDEEVREATLSGMLQEENRRSGAEAEAGSTLGEEVGPGDTNAGAGETFADISEDHNDLMAAAGVDESLRHVEMAGEYVKVLHVQGSRDEPTDGFLSPLWELTDARFDFTAYVNEKNQNRARENLRDRADDLRVDADSEDSSRAYHLQKEADWAQQVHEAAESGTTVFDLSVWVTVRGDSLEELEENERKVRKALREYPASVVPKTPIGKQLPALQSAAPLGQDELGERDPKYYNLQAMAGGIGAMLGSPTNPTFTESSGIEVGKHKSTQTPVIVDPTERENGHAWFVIADVGSGKSVNGKTVFQRLITQRQDTQGVVLEPLGNWKGTADALDAEHVVIGGDKGINPMEIRPTPERVRRNMAAGETPLASKKESVISFFKNFFAMRGLGDQFAERRAVFESSVADAYDAAGITEELDTHGRDSPTIQGELREALRDREQNPDDYAESENRAEKLKDDSSWLLSNLKPFMEDGQYENLGRESEIDLHGSETVYLDLGQSEGEVSEKAALTMQLLVLEVYEMAKQTDDWLVFAMDEFRYILRDAANLEFMETLFRHHRHHGIIPILMTQTVDEFLEHRESEAILDQCTIKQFLALDGMDKEIAEEFRLNSAQAKFVGQEAEPGSESLGYADSLLGIDGDWRQVEVHTLPEEHKVVDREDDADEPLPGEEPTDVGTASQRDDRAATAETDGGREVSD